MNVTIQLAQQIRRCGRDGHTVGEMADMLNRPDAEIMDALNMLGLPMPGESTEQCAMPTAEITG